MVKHVESMKRLKFGWAQRSKLIFYHEDLSDVAHMLNIEAKLEYTMGMNIGKLCPGWEKSFTSFMYSSHG